MPDAWIDTTKTKVDYEIPLNRHFYRYEPPRPLEVIETYIKRLEDDIMKMLKEVTAWTVQLSSPKGTSTIQPRAAPWVHGTVETKP